jgi:hypothetical protein
VATACGSPTFTAPEMRPSSTVQTNAGPLPDSAVTACIISSATNVTEPTVRNISSTTARCSSVAVSFAQMGKEIELNRLKPSAVIREPIDVDDILRKTHKLCLPTGDSVDQMKKTIVTLAIKNTFLELGLEEFDKIVLMLQKDHNCTIEDCYDSPEFLKQVLQDLLGDSYNDVLSSLKENIKNISSHKSTDNFLDALSN